jgi:tRNA pseudouridine55 synthase
MRRPKPRENELSGVLAVWKKAGPTSHDVVDMVRRAARMRQVGHTGTLDPAAEGLLVLCLGPYTKLAPYLMDTDKEYRGWFCLGAETDTDDAEGAVIAVGQAPPPTPEKIQRAAAQFVGEIEQVPPRYSAVKREGRKLYEHARAGHEIEVEPRRVTVHEFEVGTPQPCELPPALLERTADPALRAALEAVRGRLIRVPFRTVVSSGTYVRSIARDLGRALGCGGFLLALERTATGVFSAADAVAMEDLQTLTPDQLDERLRRGVEVIDRRKYPVLHLLTAYADRLGRGQPLLNTMFEEIDDAAELPSGTVCAVADGVGGILAMVQAQRLEELQRRNPYAGARIAGFRPLRIFPGGLR